MRCMRIENEAFSLVCAQTVQFTLCGVQKTKNANSNCDLHFVQYFIIAILRFCFFTFYLNGWFTTVILLIFEISPGSSLSSNMSYPLNTLDRHNNSGIQSPYLNFDPTILRNVST